MKIDRRSALVLLLFGALLIAIYAVREHRRGERITPDRALREEAPPPLSDDRDRASLLQALEQSLVYYTKIDPETRFQFGPLLTTANKMRESLEGMKEALGKFDLTDDFYRHLHDNYIFLRSDAPSVLFTGYFEANLKGSLKKSDTYQYPIYRTPDDLVSIELDKTLYPDFPREMPLITKGRLDGKKVSIPYFSRLEIDSGKLLDRNLEIAWAADPIDLFFLHIQGSGRISLENGSVLRVGFADKNGHPYRAIGKYMVEKHYLNPREVSMQNIKAYLRAHPEVVDEVLRYNPSYVFFRKLDRGPLGNIEVELTPYRSIATDAALFPKGAPAFIETEKPVFSPDGKILRWEHFSRFVFNQDTGGAIRGPGRVDLFTGFGSESEETAGSMKQPGMLHFLLKKTTLN